MSWKSNCFHALNQGPESAILAAKALLQAFPLTNACFHSLQQAMMEKLEFGFFSGDVALITQGEKGRDLFVLCRGSVDVWVDGQKVLQMQGPVLLGDKALVDPQLRRAATISVASHQLALVLNQSQIEIFSFPVKLS